MDDMIQYLRQREVSEEDLERLINDKVCDCIGIATCF